MVVAPSASFALTKGTDLALRQARCSGRLVSSRMRHRSSLRRSAGSVRWSWRGRQEQRWRAT